jgi:uncharacterized protein YfaP (DUF2135 family)
MGAAAMAGAAIDPALRQRLDGLQKQVRAGQRRSFLLAYATAAALLVGLVCWAGYHLSEIYRYAQLDPKLEIRRDPADADRLSLVYCPMSGGEVGFLRTDVDRETELLDRVDAAARGKSQTFVWRVSGAKSGDPIRVTFRQGLSLVTRELTVPDRAKINVRGNGRLTGQIVNALDKSPVPGAKVRIAGTPLLAVTDAQGRFRLEGAPTGSVPIEVSAEKFTTEKFDRKLEENQESAIRVVLSPGMKAGQIRIVLTWGKKPEDLDAHLEGPLPNGKRFQVDYRDKGDLYSQQFVRLDTDCQTGEGPETITVLGVVPGSYNFFVHDFTNRDDPHSKALAESGAEVKVYQGGQTYTFHAGHEMVGNIWKVCSINVNPTGAFLKKVDQYETKGSKEMGLYAKRTQAHRLDWIGDLGGSPASETSASEALAWLARHQAPVGSWSDECLKPGSKSFRCEPTDSCGDPGGHFDMAYTGISVLAFQAGGNYYFNHNKYSQQVRKGLDWIVDHQSRNGMLSTRGTHHDYMYEHGMSAFALAEACAVARASGQPVEPRYLEAATKAVEYIQNHQYKDGGWRYWEDPSPREAGDTSVTGWQVLALKSAREATIPVDKTCVDGVRRYFIDREMGRNGRTGYTSARAFNTEATTGIGMLAKEFLLDEPDAPLVHQAAEYLPDYAEKSWGDLRHRKESDFYTWYNCSLGMFQAGGESWNRWNKVIRDELIRLQRHDGCARGSWDPKCQWGEQGGRILSTALAALTLEVYYRYTGHNAAHGAAAPVATGVETIAPAASSKTIELNAPDKTIELNAPDKPVELNAPDKPVKPSVPAKPVELNAPDKRVKPGAPETPNGPAKGKGL